MFDSDIINYGISDTDMFKLMDILSINEASALVAGVSPTDIYYDWECGQCDTPPYLIDGNAKHKSSNADMVFELCRKALIHEVTYGNIEANIVVNGNASFLCKNSLKEDWIATNGIDSKETTIKRSDLTKWLDKKGVYPPLLFPHGKRDDYMNPKHPHYSPKLAVCVRAWEVAQTADIHEQTTKQFMSQWIKENGKALGLKNTGDKIFNELASISNWDTKGGKGKSKPTLPLKGDNDINNKSLTVHRKLVINLPDTPQNEDSNDIPF